MWILYIIVFWALIPVFYTSIEEKFEIFFTRWKRGKLINAWRLLDIIVIRFGYIYFNFVLVAKTIYKLDVKMALIIGGAIFGFALFCALLNALFSWLSDIRVLSSAVVMVAALLIGYFTDNMANAGAFLLVSLILIIIYAVNRKVSGKR